MFGWLVLVVFLLLVLGGGGLWYLVVRGQEVDGVLEKKKMEEKFKI